MATTAALAAASAPTAVSAPAPASGPNTSTSKTPPTTATTTTGTKSKAPKTTTALAATATAASDGKGVTGQKIGLSAGTRTTKAAKPQVRAKHQGRAAEPENYYEILGVEPGVSKTLLKPAYHAAIRKAHAEQQAIRKAQAPLDESFNEPSEAKAKADERAMAVTEAYRVLADDWQRSVYDLMGHAGYLAWNRHIATFAAQMLEGKTVQETCTPPPPAASCGCFAFTSRKKEPEATSSRLNVQLSPDHKQIVLMAAPVNAASLVDPEDIPDAQYIDVSNVSEVGGVGDIISVKGGRAEPLEFRTLAADDAQQLRTLLSLLLIHLQRNKIWLGRFYQVTLHSHADSISVL